ncbi:hypothetical protein [Ammoniphilus oxalaticus]|uniref:hypothetical protein n=1 Tax=Ammoniphilus oxalaticus TaxID=66863 RepID=UPI0011C45F99|nr:hypothetical protein [Ammoniphilus oxalaticus]
MWSTFLFVTGVGALIWFISRFPNKPKVSRNSNRYSSDYDTNGSSGGWFSSDGGSDCSGGGDGGGGCD